ncbi:ankyrin repeat domain-containing protein 9-like [Clarias gariepinus]|uniref:ankyrin repeat domain-containing protein 9-like n=1 Tax=Clarias gariepinus TaxID=13013 RepID=UPI00234CBAF3|nr:ankyrin repeat domain-containing protein 9-like [Clarias gariepinus]
MADPNKKRELFYRAVCDHKPVWMLEDMRKIEIFKWDLDGFQQTYSPSEALLLTIQPDHRAYAQYLLNKFSYGALAMPGGRFCCWHLVEAVHFDRIDIMSLILQVAHKMPSSRSYMDGEGCLHKKDGKTPLHLACELSNSEAVLLLLGNGASPHLEDNNGMTPLDLTLEQLWTSKENTHANEMCHKSLLMFMPQVKFGMQSALQNDPQCWSNVLGEETFNYLVGRNPGTLFLTAMQKILSQLPPQEFPQSLEKLPIPASLKSFTQSLTQTYSNTGHTLTTSL